MTPEKNRKSDSLEYPENLLFELGISYPSEDQINGLFHVLGTLTEREQEVIELHYQQQMTFREIGEPYGIDAQRIRAIRRKAFNKLRKPQRFLFVSEGLQGGTIRLQEEEERKNTKVQAEIDRIRQESRIENLAFSLRDMMLSVRIVNTLEHNGIFTLEELLDIMIRDPNRFYRIRNLGEKARKEINDKLQEYHIYLSKEDIN